MSPLYFNGLIFFAPGHLLDDEELVETLKNASHMASEVKQRLQKAFDTREIISHSRMKYERVSWNPSRNSL